MGNIYENGRALAIRQLAPISQGGKGQVVTLSFDVAGTVGPGGGVTGGGAVVQTCSGVEKSIDARRIDRENILDGDSEFVMSPVTTAGADLQLPDEAAMLGALTLADGSVRQVVRVQPKRPSGLLISVTLQLRGAGAA